MVSIVIPCLNEALYVDATLASVLAQKSVESEWEVIVADGGSDDGTRDILDEWSRRDPRYSWIDNPSGSTPNALNLGIAASRGATVIILGAHAQLAPDFVQRNCAALRAHPESGCVGGVVEQIHGTVHSQRIGTAMSTPFGVGDARFRTGGPAGHVDTVAFGAYRREVFDEIGMFDQDLARNQDDELNYRLLNSGWRIWFDPRIKSTYHVRSTYGHLLSQYRQYGYWKVLVNRKHGTVTTWRQTVPALFLASLMVSFTFWLCEMMGWLPESWTGLGASLFVSGLFLWIIIGAGSAISAATKPSDVLGILRAYAVIHGGYGWGYWQGIFRFIILRAQPSSTAARLTR